MTIVLIITITILITVLIISTVLIGNVVTDIHEELKSLHNTLKRKG